MPSACRRSTAIAFLACAVLSPARADITSAELLEDFGLTPDEIAELENGEVLAFSDEEIEFSKRELATDAMVQVDTDHSAILLALKEDATLIPVKLLQEYHTITDESDFAGVELTEDNFAEVEKLFGSKLGKEFNLSAGEITTVQQILEPHRGGTRAQMIEAASTAMRAVLKGRYNAYRTSGIAGIEPYQRSSRKRVDIGAELQLTNNAAAVYRDEFPEFVRVLGAYPEGAECCEHEYRWLKVRIRKRNAFALAHTIILSTDDFAIITERHFYISNTLNSVQITVLWLPHGDKGSIGLAMSASADVLDSVMGRVLRGVGRNLAKDMVTDAMIDIRDDLEAKSPDD